MTRYGVFGYHCPCGRHLCDRHLCGRPSITMSATVSEKPAVSLGASLETYPVVLAPHGDGLREGCDLWRKASNYPNVDVINCIGALNFLGGRVR